MPTRTRSSVTAIALGLLLAAGTGTARVSAQSPGGAHAHGNTTGALDAFSVAVESMVQRVSPSVVQILVSRYGARDQNGRNNVVSGWEHSIGSGVIIAANGYIITNAHVVDGAQQVRVRLVPSGAQTVGSVLAESFASLKDATVVGTFVDGDLALLKIAAEGLPVLPIGDVANVRQGQVVFAFGSPEGLQNSVSMGVVSSIARQLDPDSPMLYIQTDAPINPGSSGGPLVNTAGEMVGLDTFIRSQSGGNEGIGFALPAALVRFVFDQLRKYGHVHRPVIGAGLQTITPTLAAALELPRDSGVLVSDVLPNSPAAAAGLKLDDLLLTIDNRPLDNVAALAALSFQHVPGSPMKVQVLRGTRVMDFEITPVEVQDDTDHLSDLAGLSTSVVAKLGVLAVTVDTQTAAAVGELRLASGALIVARTADFRAADVGLQAGDVIHEVNRTNVFSVDDLESALAKLRPGAPAAILIERAGKWFYLSFDTAE